MGLQVTTYYHVIEYQENEWYTQSTHLGKSTNANLIRVILRDDTLH